MAIDPKFLSGPVPGMSLTGEPGNNPWENPPQFAAIEDVIDFYSERMMDEEVESSVISALDGGVSVEVMAEQVLSSGVMNGVHTYDVAVLVNPIVRELIMYMADINGVDYIESYDKQIKEKKVPLPIAKEIAREITQEMKQSKPAMPEMPARKGLMSKPQMMEE